MFKKGRIHFFRNPAWMLKAAVSLFSVLRECCTLALVERLYIKITRVFI